MSECPPGTSYHFPPFHLRSDVDLLYRGEEVVPLEPQAVKVLRYLVQNHTRVVPKTELHDAVWRDVFTSDSVLKKAVYQARRVLRQGAGRDPIRTFHSQGYQFVAPVSVAAEEPAEVSRRVESDPNRPDYDQLVGRDSELAALEDELAATRNRRGRPVLLTGIAGIGKTQLAHRFLEHARRAGAVCLAARFYDYPASTLAPFETFTDLLRKAMHVPGHDLEELRAAIQQRLGGSLPRELGAAVSGDAGFRAADGEIFRAVVPIADCFVRLSREAPLVLVLDDIQWADGASLEVIGYLMRTAVEEQLMIVGLVRTGEPETDSTFQNWLERQGRYRTCTTIPLGALDEASLYDCMLRIFGGESRAPEIPRQEFRQIVETSGGNPYFFTEMLRVLTAAGAIRREQQEPGRWIWSGTGETRLPDSLVMAARDRLGRLSPEVLALVEEAAVIGEEFRLVTLATMSGRDLAEVERLCAVATARGVLLDTNVSATEDRRFLHAILRRVVYDGITFHRRRSLHAQTAAAIERVYAEEIERVAGVVAGHYERAGLAEQTRDWSIRAARVAAGRWEWSEVVMNLERARAAAADSGAPVDVHQQIAVEMDLGEAYLSLGRPRDAERLLTGAAALADAGGHTADLAAALLKLGQTRIALSEYRDALAATEKSHALYAGMANAEGIQRSLVQIGTIQVAMGSYDLAVPVIESVLQSAGEDSEAAALARGTLGWARALQGRWDAAVPLLRRAIRDSDRLGDARRRAILLRRLHWVELSRGELESAVSLAFAAREASRRVGDAAAEAKCNMGIGQARTAQGLWEEGISFLQATMDSLATIGDRHCEAEALWLLGRARLETGATREAKRHLETALRMIREIGDRDDEFRILADLADCLRTEGDLTAAGAACAEAERIAGELGNDVGIALTRLQRARLALASGDSASAAAVAEDAAATLERNGSGESWRAWWMVGQAHTEGGRLDVALDATTRALSLLERLRDQIASDDVGRRETVSAARRPQAADFVRLLRRMGRESEAATVAGAWDLDMETTSRPTFGRVAGSKRSAAH